MRSFFVSFFVVGFHLALLEGGVSKKSKKTLNFWEEEEEDLFFSFSSLLFTSSSHTPSSARGKEQREREREKKKSDGKSDALPGVAKSEKIVVPFFFCFQDDESDRVETRDDDDFGFLQQRVEKAFFDDVVCGPSSSSS